MCMRDYTGCATVNAPLHEQRERARISWFSPRQYQLFPCSPPKKNVSGHLFTYHCHKCQFVAWAPREIIGLLINHGRVSVPGHEPAPVQTKGESVTNFQINANCWRSIRRGAPASRQPPSAPPHLSPELRWANFPLRESSDWAATGLPACNEAGGSEHTTPLVVLPRDQVTGAGRKEPYQQLTGQISRMNEHGNYLEWKMGR